MRLFCASTSPTSSSVYASCAQHGPIYHREHDRAVVSAPCCTGRRPPNSRLKPLPRRSCRSGQAGRGLQSATSGTSITYQDAFPALPQRQASLRALHASMPPALACTAAARMRELAFQSRCAGCAARGRPLERLGGLQWQLASVCCQGRLDPLGDHRPTYAHPECWRPKPFRSSMRSPMFAGNAARQTHATCTQRPAR